MVIKNVINKTINVGRHATSPFIRSRRPSTSSTIGQSESYYASTLSSSSNSPHRPNSSETGQFVRSICNIPLLQSQSTLFGRKKKVTPSEFPSCQVHQQLPFDEDLDVGQPLCLTPYIQNGQINEAQALASVTSLTHHKIQSYSGFLTVNDDYNSNLFFWFFPALMNPEEAPLLLWLNGGPGASSMFGCFSINGPIMVDRNQELQHRNATWALNHSVLYIDSPVGTGFSFTEDDSGYARKLEDVTTDLFEALNQFFKLFPKFRSRDFYVTGQSYTGKYAPAICHKIHMENKTLEENSRINLRGMAIGAGMCDPEIQADYGSFLYNIGLIDELEKEYFDRERMKLLECIQKKSWTDAHKILQELVVGWPRPIRSRFESTTGYSFNSNYLHANMPEAYGTYIQFIQSEHVRRSIHVGNREFGKDREKVYMYLSDDFAQSVKPLIEELLDEDYKVLLYASQLDVIVPHTGISKFIGSLKWKHSKDYRKLPRSVWRVQDEIAGYVKSTHNLTHLFVRDAGHSAGIDQPERCLDMITRFTRDLSFG